MPSWPKSLDEEDVRAVIAYLITIYPFFEDDLEDEFEEEEPSALAAARLMMRT